MARGDMVGGIAHGLPLPMEERRPSCRRDRVVVRPIDVMSEKDSRLPRPPPTLRILRIFHLAEKRYIYIYLIILFVIGLFCAEHMSGW